MPDASRLALATRHIGDILRLAIEHDPEQKAQKELKAPKALVIADTQSELAVLLKEAYALALPEAECLEFKAENPEAVHAALARLQPHDLVVLVQSSNFRLAAFRLRVELFKRGVKVIEHMHLDRMSGHEIDIYIDALAYDPVWLRQTGQALKNHLDQSQTLVIETELAQAGENAETSKSERLILSGGFESAMLNVGDYSRMNKVGGLFPIGEVFTEAKALENVQGRLSLFAFADIDFRVACPEKPITVTIEKGRVVATEHATPAFEQVLDRIRQDEGEIWVREVGFGLNRAFSPTRMVSDVGTYERMCGVHFSLGAKHAVYDKPEFKRKVTRHHVDVFAATKAVLCDGMVLFEKGQWRV